MASLDTAPLDRLSAEATVSAKDVAAVLEGIEDFLRLNLSSAAKVQLERLRSLWTTRLNKSQKVIRGLAEAKAEIEALIADGHPNEPVAIVDKEVIEEMDANRDTLEAARRRFSPRPITKGGRLEVGGQERVARAGGLSKQ